MFFYSRKKNKLVYEKLCLYTENICQLFVKYGYKEKLLANRDNNVIIIYSHLLFIVRNNALQKYNFKSAEKISKLLLCELLIRMDESYSDSIFEYASSIITQFAAIQRTINEKKEPELNLDLYKELSTNILREIDIEQKYFLKKDSSTVQLLNETYNYLKTINSSFDFL